MAGGRRDGEAAGAQKVLVVLGTRPEAIKLAPVIFELRRRPDLMSARICVTAQHREMLDGILALFRIVPDHDLNIMAENQSPTAVASMVLERLDPVLAEERPDWVVVQGDTTSAAAAAMAAFYARIPVGHVEAGLRTGDRHNPFPEEINRRLVACTADLHFAPTDRARDNLLAEGVSADRIHVTGNTVIDAVQWTGRQPPPGDGLAASLPAGRRIVLVTAHRRENFGAALQGICDALLEIAAHYPDDVQVVWPVHPNPNVRRPVHERLAGVANVTLTEPLDYLPFVHLMQRSHLILTDSGGIQEEAPGLGKPVLVLRRLTERLEGVEAGTVLMVGTEAASIAEATSRLLDDEAAYAHLARAHNPYGDGHAAPRIVESLRRASRGP